MQPTPQAYKQRADKAVPPTKKVRNFILAFVVGGAICTLGQALLELYKALGMEKVEAGSLTSVSLIFLSALFTGLHIYDKLARYAGAGTLVPITGFANAMVSPALEFRPEGMIMGVGAKLFTIAGPVIAYGLLASAVYGVILWIVGLFA